MHRKFSYSFFGFGGLHLTENSIKQKKPYYQKNGNR